MPGKDRDLESHLEGLFADLSSAPEEEVEIPQSLEEAVAGLLEQEEEPTETAEMAEEMPPLTMPTEEPPVESLPSEEQAVELEERLQEQRAQVLHRMLATLSVIGGLIVIALIANVIRDPKHWTLSYIPYIAIYTVLVVLTLKRDLGIEVRASGIIALAYLIGTFVLWQEGPLSAGGLYLLAGAILAAVLLGMRAGIIGVTTSSLIYAGFLFADHLGLLTPSIPYDPSVLPSIIAQSITFVFIAAAVMFPQTMLYRALLTALRDAAEKQKILVRSQAIFAARADELGRANALLKKRTLQLQTVADVSGVAAFSVVDADELMRQVVTLIRDRLDLYYVGLFLSIAPEVEGGRVRWAELRADAGPDERQFQATGYRARVDASSTVGRCILNAKAYVAGGHRLRLVSPDGEETLTILPGTRSEIALPLRSRGRVLGALTLQSTQPDAFPSEDVPVLQTMADQIGVAIDNARLFAEAQARVQEMEEIQKQYGRERWAELVPSRVPPLYERRREDVPPLGEALPPEVLEVIEQGRAIVRPGNGEAAALVAPISLRDEIIGALGLHDATGGRLWSEDEVALVEAVADQMALAIENARLLDETRRRAERERLTADITAQVRASTDVDSILRTAIRELGRALRASDGIIQLKVAGE